MQRWVIIVILSIPLCGYAQNWQSMGNFNSYPTSIFADSLNGLLYVGGHFTQINSETRWGVATWNTASWDSLGLGIDNDSISTPGPIKCFVQDGNYIYAVGAFRRAGTINTTGIARWNGFFWDSVPGCRIPDYQAVSDIIKYNGDIYICGDFDSVGNIPAHGLAKWDGNSWQSVATNYDFSTLGFLNRIRFYDGQIYVSGNFPDSNGNTCRLAKWDGSNWNFMTSAIQGSIAAIEDMEVYQGKLYVAGLFFQSAGNVANSLQSWNDTTWCAVGGSVQIVANQNPTIRDLCVHNNMLYCCGNFEKIGGVMAHCLAIWNGTDWCSLGSTFDNAVMKIAFFQDTLYVIGGFTNIDQTPATYTAKWVGGNYIDTCGHLTTNVAGIYETQLVSIWPNPSNAHLYFEFQDLHIERSVIIYDGYSREIWRKETSESSIEFPASEFLPGLYFYRIEQENAVSASGKFIIQH